MIKTRLDLSGLAAIEKDLAMLSKAENVRVKRSAVRAGAAVFRDAARDNVPVRTGRLRRNIVVDGARGDPSIAGVIVRTKGKGGGKNNAFYWRFVELGTSKMPADPFMRTAFDQKEEEAADAAEAKLMAEIDRILAK